MYRSPQHRAKISLNRAIFLFRRPGFPAMSPAPGEIPRFSEAHPRRNVRSEPAVPKQETVPGLDPAATRETLASRSAVSDAPVSQRMSVIDKIEKLRFHEDRLFRLRNAGSALGVSLSAAPSAPCASLRNSLFDVPGIAKNRSFLKAFRTAARTFGGNSLLPGNSSRLECALRTGSSGGERWRRTSIRS